MYGMPTPDLFADQPQDERIAIGPQAFVLRGFALTDADALLQAVNAITQAAPFRHMVTPGGFTMSVALTNCGALGWASDRHGYRYSPTDPESGLPWPPMPEVFSQLAGRAANAAGFKHFEPDACLINRYQPGTKLSLHQDRDERDYGQPIVSMSLGMPATFLFGGQTRSGKSAKIPLQHGDVMVWGGVDRLRFHGVLPLEDNPHPQLGGQRINLTFRKAG
jgi:alkylated DNA repair protein (DNA oxidative demethylase)